MGEAEFDVAPNLGWAVAIGVGLAVVSFIFSRFTAGMAKQTVWRNLRGGAAWTAGNALLLLVVAASAALRYLGNDVAAGRGMGGACLRVCAGRRNCPELRALALPASNSGEGQGHPLILVF